MTKKKMFFTLLVYIALVIITKLITILLSNYFSINIENSILVGFFTIGLVIYVLFKYKTEK